MKLSKSFLWLGMLISIQAMTQQPSDTSRHWSFQLTAGAQGNYFTDEQPHGAINTGMNAQFRVNYALKNNWGLFAECGYAGTGGTLVSFTNLTALGFPGTIQYVNTKQSQFVIHAFESSLGVSYKIPMLKGWNIRLYTAPQLAFNLSEWEKYQKTGLMIEKSANTDPAIYGTIMGHQYTDYFEPYWFNVYGGIQFELPLKRNAFLLDLRFVNGVTSIRKDYSYIHTSQVQGNIRTNSFRIGAGYLLYGRPAKKKSSNQHK